MSSDIILLSGPDNMLLRPLHPHVKRSEILLIFPRLGSGIQLPILPHQVHWPRGARYVRTPSNQSYSDRSVTPPRHLAAKQRRRRVCASAVRRRRRQRVDLVVAGGAIRLQPPVIRQGAFLKSPASQ